MFRRFLLASAAVPTLPRQLLYLLPYDTEIHGLHLFIYAEKVQIYLRGLRNVDFLPAVHLLRYSTTKGNEI